MGRRAHGSDEDQRRLATERHSQQRTIMQLLSADQRLRGIHSSCSAFSRASASSSRCDSVDTTPNNVNNPPPLNRSKSFPPPLARSQTVAELLNAAASQSDKTISHVNSDGTKLKCMPLKTHELLELVVDSEKKADPFFQLDVTSSRYGRTLEFVRPVGGQRLLGQIDDNIDSSKCVHIAKDSFRSELRDVGLGWMGGGLEGGEPGVSRMEAIHKIIDSWKSRGKAWRHASLQARQGDRDERYGSKEASASCHPLVAGEVVAVLSQADVVEEDSDIPPEYHDPFEEGPSQAFLADDNFFDCVDEDACISPHGFDSP